MNLTVERITAAEYFGPYDAHASITAEIRYKATVLLDVVNDLYARAAEDGCEFPDNPFTGCGISGQGNGGYRPPECKVGATNSTHKEGRGIDRYDPRRQFASWCLAHTKELEKRGLYMEDPRWTTSWVHLQDVPPRSAKRVYVPSESLALAPNPPEWRKA